MKKEMWILLAGLGSMLAPVMGMDIRDFVWESQLNGRYFVPGGMGLAVLILWWMRRSSWKWLIGILLICVMAGKTDYMMRNYEAGQAHFYRWLEHPVDDAGKLTMPLGWYKNVSLINRTPVKIEYVLIFYGANREYFLGNRR